MKHVLVTCGSSRIGLEVAALSEEDITFAVGVIARHKALLAGG